jgi:signal transduction histidine kinase
MILDTQTTIFMICLVYLMLHAGIWFALLEYRNLQIKLWCGSGLISGVAVVLLAARGFIPDFVFFYVAQVLMLVGNWGRMVALRIYLLPAPQQKPFQRYVWANTAYMLVFCYLIYFHQAIWEGLIWFNLFYTVLCFDYFWIGYRLNQRQDSLGARLLMWAGLSFSISLGVRTLAVIARGDISDIYAPSWDQGVMIFGQFTAITLSNIGFLRIFLEIAERKKIAAASELASATERAKMMRKSSDELQRVLKEREEIIRQLTIFNKTAGMGALVASLAHELNQPLAAIQLNAELIDNALDQDQLALNDPAVKDAVGDLLRDNQRAARIITTLRNMFGNGKKTLSDFDLNAQLQDVLLLCKPKLRHQNIALQMQLHPAPLIVTADKAQMQQVLLNLITNAIEALTNPDSTNKTITVATHMTQDHIELSVTDNGVGIDDAMAANVFELLRTNKEDGMGVGLWLSRSIVEAHAGTIHFESEVQKGARFVMTLPRSTDTMIY